VTGTLSSMPPSNKRTSPRFFGLKYVTAVFAPGARAWTGGSRVFNGWREDGTSGSPVGYPMRPGKKRDWTT
jgi:hypothetical protein